METIERKQTEISVENLQIASKKILEFASKRKLVVTGEIPTTIPAFENNSQMKDFRRALTRVLFRTTMRSSNYYLHLLFKRLGISHKVKVDYSDKEKAIQKAKTEWKEIDKKAKEARIRYRLEKGDFYKM